MIHRPDYSQLDTRREVFFLASGGRDSTAMVLEAHSLGLRGTMLFNDTGLDRGGEPVLRRLADLTGYPLVVLKYDGDTPAGEILRKSFLRIPEVLAKMKSTGRYWKNYFYCCKALKHGPTERYLRTLDKESAVLVLGIKGSDGSVTRRLRLAELRDRQTFLRRHRNGRLYYYPLRDCSDADVAAVLDEYGLAGISSSGCSLCPVFCLFAGMVKKEPSTWLRSVNYARRLGIRFEFADQTELMHFCPGDDG